MLWLSVPQGQLLRKCQLYHRLYQASAVTGSSPHTGRGRLPRNRPGAVPATLPWPQCNVLCQNSRWKVSEERQGDKPYCKRSHTIFISVGEDYCPCGLVFTQTEHYTSCTWNFSPKSIQSWSCGRGVKFLAVKDFITKRRD